MFEQSPTLECTLNWLVGGSVTVASGSQGCVPDTNPANSRVSVTGSGQVSVQVTVTFAASMLGQLSVQAKGSNQQGQLAPLTEVTKFTVTGTPAPMMLTSGSSSFTMPAGAWTQGRQTVVLLNGAVGPVSVSLQTVYSFCTGYFAALLSQMNAGNQSAVVSAYGYGASAGNCVYATFNLSAPGLTTVLDSMYFGTSTVPFYNASTPATIYTAGQGTTLSVPVTFTPFLLRPPQPGDPPVIQNVNLAVSMTAGITATWSVGALSLTDLNPATVTLKLAVDRGLARGTYAVLISGAGNAYYIYVTVTPNQVPDFSISAITPVSLTAGQPVSFTMLMTPLNGFNGAVTVSSPGVPDQIGIPRSAIGIGFSPATTPASYAPQTVTGTINTTAVTANDTYTIPVMAQSGGVSHTTTVTVQVRGGTGPDFRFGGPASLSAHPNVPATSSLTLQPIAGFAGTVSLTASSVPAGLVVGLTTRVALAGGVAAAVGISVSAPAGVTSGTYTLNVQAVGGGVSHAVAIAVTVSPTPSISLSFPNFQSLQVGQSMTFTVAVTTQNYTGGPIAIAPVALPVGVAMLPVTAALGATSVAVTMTASKAAMPNRYSFYLVGTGGGITSSPQTVILTIPNFVITPMRVMPVAPGGTVTVTSSVAPVGSYAGAVSLSYGGGTGGFGVSGPGSAMPGGTFGATVTAAAGAAAMSYPTMTATDSMGLSVTIPVGAFATSAITSAWCSGYGFGYFDSLSLDPYTTGQIGAILAAEIRPSSYTAGWTSTIQNAKLVYYTGALVDLGNGTYAFNPVEQLIATNTGQVVSNGVEKISLSVPASGGAAYQGPGAYAAKATFSYRNPNCEIHPEPWAWGDLSSDLHTFTRVDWPFTWIGYDITPVITSLYPTTVSPGPVNLVITGVGFGDHPTVVIGPASAPVATVNPGTPATDANGNQIITISFTVPDSSVGTTLDVVVQSSGEFGSPFQGANNSKPQSRPTGLNVRWPPTISNVTPVVISTGLPSGDVPLTITGTGLSPSPTVSLPPGIRITGIDSVTPTQIVGSFAVDSSANIGSGSLSVTVGGLKSNAFSVTLDGPDHMEVQADTVGRCSGCLTTVLRSTTYRVKNKTASIASGIFLCEVPTFTVWTCTQAFPGMRFNQCGKVAAGLPITDSNGDFTDMWSLNDDRYVPIGCGTEGTVDIWYWEKVNSAMGPAEVTVPIGKLNGFAHTDAIQFNNVKAPPDTFPIGTKITPN